MSDVNPMILKIAIVCHEANRAYCRGLGDDSQRSWEDASDFQRSSAVLGVLHHLTEPNSSPADSHNVWLKHKTDEGWTYGEVKDAERKTHPCFRPFEELPHEQQVKDVLFKAIVDALRPPPIEAHGVATLKLFE